MTNGYICGYGCYIPRFRIKREEIRKVWGHFEGKISEKAVIGYDEDTCTMAVEAAKNAIKASNTDRDEVGVVAVGSSSPPYALRSLAAEVAMALGLSKEVRVLDFKESEKAGTSALLTCLDIVQTQGGKGLVIASDAPAAIAADSIENAYGASAAALIVGREEGLAKIEGTKSALIEIIADRFRKEGSVLVEDLGIPQYHQITYNNAIQHAVTALLRDLKLSSSDFQHLFIQGHDTREPASVLRKIGFDKSSLHVETLDVIGDSAAASVLIGLVGILEKAIPGERILCASYGAGAGSDAFSVLVKDVQPFRKDVPQMTTYLENKYFIDYNQYLKLKELINLES